MKLFQKKRFIFYVALLAISNVHGQDCSRTYNIMKCAFDIVCRNNVERFSIYIFRNSNGPLDEHGNQIYLPEIYNDEDFNSGLNHTYDRQCKFISDHNSETFYPVYLKFTEPYSMEQSIPEQNINIEYIITHLDLSNNAYSYIPDILKLENLALLDVSRNSLNIAELSNTAELQSLTEIDLSHNIIKDIKYEHTHVYRRLKKIDLSYNYLTKISEAMFYPFNELETLDISHNYIDILSPISFEGMRQLLHLNLSYNRICDINSSLFRFSELKLLDLSNNNINAIKTNDFDKLTMLEILNLNSNLISVIDRDAFDNMPSLWSLNLNNNKLRVLDKDVFINLGNLKSIDLSENNFEKLPKHLFKGKYIKDFSVKGNNLEGSLEKGTFEGLAFVKQLDLGNQNLGAIEDYAFYGLNLEVLLLNNNNISVLTTQSLSTCRSLQRLDLSFNKIQSISFEKNGLFNLISLSLKNNHLSVIKQEIFHGLSSLQFLDLSDNKITELETKSFESLKELINFQISNNPLNGTLQKRTFDGLSSLPSLDISCTLLSTIQNGSFMGMTQLKYLNVSHSKINTLEYNIFVYTGLLEAIDLSFNELKEFNINSTELNNLNTLYLNNNLIKVLDPLTIKNILSLSKLDLSHNAINKLEADAFSNLNYLQSLDVSFNPNLNVTLELFNAIKVINHIDFSGIKTSISFGTVKDITVKHLVLSDSNVVEIERLKLNDFHNLDSLVLNHNKITKLKSGSFSNINTLRFLDMSHNKLNYIQPGVFANNTMLVTLNVSHNLLTVLPYGIFEGLIYLRTLDISYNNVDDLQNERFYEVQSLNVLIADHNNIKSITADEFFGTHLTLLSIGGNPIPCDVLVKLKRSGVPFTITAAKLYENSDENVNGVTCNRKLSGFDQIVNGGNNTNVANSDNVKVLLSIRDIMLEHYKNDEIKKVSTNIDDKYVVNITNQIQTFNADISEKVSDFINSTKYAFSELLTNSTTARSNETNNLLSKILRVLTLNSATKAPPIQVTKDNATFENLLTYVNKIKQDLDDTFKLDKESILKEVDAKISAIKSDRESILNEVNYRISSLNSPADQNNILPSLEPPKHEKLSASFDSNSLFTETCVALILVILVGFVLFKVYKSGVFVRRRLSISTRELPGSMDSPL